MKKIQMITVLLAMLLPTMLFAKGEKTYSAAVKAQVAQGCSGWGKVYAGKTNEAGTYDVTSSADNSSYVSSAPSFKFYLFAQPLNEGYEFTGWSTANNEDPAATGRDTSSPKEVTETGVEGTATPKIYYAYFKEKTLAAFSMTFETSANGTYTVDGAAPANKTGLTKATSVVLASSDSNFLNWNINGTVVNNNPYTLSCTENTTVSADFLTADQVTSVTTISDLTSALSNAAYKKIIVPSGTSLTVAKGSTVTIPSGKQLVVDGTLNVLGTVSNSGVISGSGKLYKISYLIDQGDVITVKTADGKECGAMTCSCQDTKMPRYCKTTVTQNSPSVNGTVSCTTSWGVLLNGTTAYAISKQSPKAVKVSLDTAKDSNGKQSVVNKITAVTADTDTVNENANYVLFADMTMTGPLDSSKLRSTATVDCAGKKLSAGTNSHSSFGISVLNGSFSASASQWQNAHAAFFNVSSVSLSKVKGTGSTYYFYDCGTKASPCSVSITYYSNTRTSDYKTAYFYSGYYSYSFNTTNDSGKCNVYGGSYTADPASYIPTAYDGILQSKYDGSKYYVVTDYTPPSYVCAVGGVEYETLPDAVAAAGNGSLITLSAAIELEETLTIPSGKNITISLEKHTIQGGKIVNNGTLTITDSITGNGTTVNDVSGGIVKCDIENNGTLDFIFGSYTGAIVNKAGTLTTHNGLFTGALTKNGGTVNLKGGHFTQDVSSFVTADGYDVITYGGKNSVCELPDGTLYDTEVSSAAGYGATPFSNADFTLFKKWVSGSTSRTDYSAAEWARVAEIMCFYQVFNSKGLDPTLMFDRVVAASSVNLYAKSGQTSVPVPLKFDVSAGTPYRALSEYLIGNGYYSKTYKAIFVDNISSVGVAVSDKSGSNKGTVCKVMVEIWSDDRASDYSSTGRKVTNTVYVVGQKLFTIDAGSNKAMIRPATGAATFYATLGAAMDAAADGGTVMLANDCDTALPLNKAGTYTFDTMGFAASDAVSVGDGLFVKSETAVDSSAKILVPDAKATTYVVAQKVASVGETFYDNLTEAVGAANGATVTLLAATDETITLGEGQTLSLNKNGIAFDDAKVVTSVEGSSVKATTAEGVTVYSLVKDVVTSGEAHYPSIEAAIEAAEGNTVAVTVVATDTETIDLDAGKTLVVTVADGVTANVTVDPSEGAFIDTTTDGNTTTYVSKKITVEMEEPPAQATVEVVKVDHGVTNAVLDTSLVDAAVHALTGNHDVSRTDNTDKLDVLDKITVTPTKIVEDVTSGTMIIRSATFDVVPHLKAGQSLAEGQKLKFRLPVDASATQLSAIVYHGTAQFGIFAVQTYNNEKFVEVESDTFSPYGYELLDGETANPIAAIGTTGYASLAAAVAAVPTDGTETTITMLAGETIAADAGITIAAGKNIVLDLNGQTVQMAAASADERWLIKNEGTLTVKDSAENGKLLMSATGQASTAVHKSTIKNMGALTVESGTIELTYSGTNKEEPTAIMNDASDRATSLTVKGGTVVNSANRGMGVYLAVNDTNATVFDVQGGRVEGFGAAVRYYFDDRNLTDAKLTFNMSNGTVHGRGMYGVQGMTTSSKDWNGISFNISGGTVSCAGLLGRKSVISPLQGTVSISGGTFAGDVYIYGHALEITDGDFAGSVTLHRTKESLESASISGGQFSSGLTIAETTADNTTNPYYNAKFITGGIYGTAPEARNVVDEYAVVDNTDSDTQGDYPKTIGGAVASVTAEGNTTYYATLSDAITAANASDVTEITILDSSITTSPDADWKVVGNKLVKKSYVAQISDVKYQTFAEAIEAAEEYKTANGDYPVITVLDATAEQGNADWKIVDDKLVHKLYVAQIGSTKYESLAEAVAAASAGATVELIADDRVSLTSGGEIVIDKALTITGPVDGEGKPLYTIYGTEDATGTNRILVDGSGTVTLSNLNIAGFGNDHATDASHAAVYVASTFTGTVNLSNLNISDFNRGGVFLYGGTFNVTDCTIDCANSRSGAFTKGIEIRNNASGTIADSTILGITSESAESVAGGIEFYGNGAVTVSGCTIEGDSMGAIGIGTAGFTDTTTTGTITVEDCDITVYYAALYATVLGEGLGENGTTIKVKSGDYTADNFAASALYGTIAIEGGTFTGLLCEGDAESGESGSLSISGGLFDDDVFEEYCADSYIPTVDEDTGLNTVKHGTYVAAIYDANDDLVGKYETLADAFADASEGDTVLLLTDVTEALAYGENISATLNLNGKTISVSSGYAISVTAGELTVTSVVDDDGYATGGIVGAISVSDGASLKLTGGIYDVDWDECDIEGSIAVSSVNRFYDSDPTEVEAASAVFTSPVPYEYCSTGFIPGAYDDIYIDGEFYYYVKEGTYLWKITDADGKVAYSEEVPYADDDEEWWEYDWFGEHEMNRNGFTMTLLHDVSADDDNFSAYVSGLTYTVDLGGHTVNQQMGFGVGECDVTIVNGTVSNAGGTAISIANGAQVTLGNGLVIAQSTTGVYVEGGTEEGAYSKLTVKNGAAINGTYGVLVFGSGSSNPVTEVVVEGGTITGTIYGISGNGTIEGDTDYSNTRITVSGGTVSGGEVGIYHPEAGELSVSGGTISGKMAIYARSGTIAVTGGSLNATGTSGEYNVSYAGNELQQTGDALVLDAVDYPGGNPTATISGGTFVSVNGDGVASYAATGQSAESGFVSGGTFSSEVPEEYCADGFIPTGADPDTGLYTVKAGSYVAQIVRAGEVIAKYETLADAIDAAQNDDTVELLANIANFTGTQTIDKSLTLDGAGHSITAAAVPADGHRNMVNAFMGGTSMLKIEGDVTLRNITLDGDATHRYTYLVSADNSSAKLTTSNVRLLNGGELAGDANGAIVEQGAGYGAGIHLNNGAQLVVSNGFYACTGGPDGGVFPFTGILPEGGASVSFELTENPNDPANVDIGSDLLLVGMVGVIPLDQVQVVLDYMKVPSRFIPYTLTLGDGSAYAFTGASPRTWNDIIDYGKEIMDVSTAIGYEGLDKVSTPVEVGLLTDTVLPDTFRFADTNFTVNGNGNALSGTIKYTDNAGLIEDIVLGTEDNPLVLDLTDVTQPIEIGSGISVSNVTIQMTAEQATAGTPVIIWDAAHGVDAPENEAGVSVVLVDDQGQPTSDMAELIWDDEMGMAYIGPCEARLTGPTHETPIYTTLANAIVWAEQTGDTVTLMTNIVNFTGTQTITKQDLVIDGAGYSITAAPVSTHRDVVNAWAGSTAMFKLETGDVTFRNITLDGDATHAYTFLISADNSSITLTTENVRLLNGGELCGDANGAIVEQGAGYGAAVHLNNGAHMVVSNGFYACTGGKTAGCFPFTGILVDTNGGDVKFELTGNPNDPENVDIGGDLLLVGMPGVIPLDQTQGMLDYMKVPTRFIPYTLTLGDGSAYAFTGASPLGWNDIINYGKEIMDVSTAIGYQGLDKISTPVEVGLLTDTVLPDTFRFADTNFTVNGNGNALAGTIEYTDNAGLIHDIVLGTEGNALVLDMTETTKPIVLGSGISVTNVTIEMTAEQATAGTPVIIWDAAHGVDAPANEAGVTVQIVDDQGESTGVTKELIWDDEMGLAYIGPVEARLTGPTHDKPIYTTLADAIARAEQSGDTVTLMTNIVDFAGSQMIVKDDLVLDGAGHTITAAPVTDYPDFFAAYGGDPMLKLGSGAITLKNITLDGGATHRYTYLVSADNDSVSLTTENITLLHGGAQSLDTDGNPTPGVGYGAAIHLNNGAKLTVKDGFYADTHGAPAEAGQTIAKADGIFPFTAILPEGGSAVSFDLTADTDANPTVSIGEDLLLVGMLGAIPHDQMQGILDYMKVPKRFIPYTLTIADGASYAFTGGSPRRWNDIIDYGKEIMDAATATGFDGLNKDTTPVEVGLLVDTILPAGADGDGYDFLYEDSNFSINGNGNALSGTIKFTDDADGGLMEDITLGTQDNPLTLDLSETDKPVDLGDGVVIQDVVVLMTEDQATLGKVVFDWDVTDEYPPDDEQGVTVTVVNSSGEPTGEEKGLVWDEEYGVAYIGPVEARLTGSTHETPVYTSLANALDIAKDNDKVELLTNAVLSAVQGVGSDVTLDLAGYKVSVNGAKGLLVTNATLVIADTSVKTNGTICAGDEASPASLIESGNGGVVNIPTGIFAAASGQNVLVTSDNGAFAVSGGYFSNPVLPEHCAPGYAPIEAPAGAPQQYTVGETVPEFRYPIDGTAGVPVTNTWLATYMSDIYDDPTKPIFANITNDLVQALSVDGANGIPRWESYVLGLDPTDPKAQLRLTATSKDAATVTITGLIDTTKFPEIENVAVTFRLAEQNSDKWTDVDGCTGSDVPSFTRPLEGVADKVLRIFADIEVR